MVGGRADQMEPTQELNQGISLSNLLPDDVIDGLSWECGLEEPELGRLLHPFPDTSSPWDIESLLA